LSATRAILSRDIVFSSLPEARMPEPSSLLSAWDNFYVIVGSSAGALIGLQFVVIALIANSELAGSPLEIRAFGTPTVVHFCFVLLVAL
jgi:hypothetical protein